MSIYRNLFGGESWSGEKWNPLNFRRTVLASRFLLEKYELKGLLQGHSGCVNSVLFSQDGQHIFTGSDDTNVNIYLTETSNLVETFPSIHTNNIFYARDLPGSDMNTILTCAADGRVVITNLATKGARKLHRHRGRAHRIALVPFEDNQFYSCGEDGVCCLFDLRQGTSAIFQEQGSSLEEDVFAPTIRTEFRNNRDRVCSIYTVGVNPLFPYEVAIAGSCNHICLHDSRMFDKPVSFLCPNNLATSSAHVTGIKYDHTGSLLIGSYNDDDVYSFILKENTIPTRRTSQTVTNHPHPHTLPQNPSDDDSVQDEDVSEQRIDDASLFEMDRGYYRRYTGHRNSNTVKQVSFMGGRSDYVVSGSDCGYLFIWDTNTGEQVQLLKADEVGAINCLSAHPVLPILATSGLESDAKLWSPTGEHNPIAEGTEKARVLKRLVDRNAERNSEGSYSNSLLNLLLALINRGDFPLHSQDSDDEEFDDEEDEEDEDNEDDDNEEDEEKEKEEEEEEEDDDDDDDEEDDDDDEISGDEIGPQPIICSTAAEVATRSNSRRERWTRTVTQCTARSHRQETNLDVREETVRSSGSPDSAGSPRSPRTPSPRSAGSDEESDEGQSEMELDDESLGSEEGIIIDGEHVPFSRLARLLPAILGRRRRSPNDTGDEAKREDEEERLSSSARGEAVMPNSASVATSDAISTGVNCGGRGDAATTATATTATTATTAAAAAADNDVGGDGGGDDDDGDDGEVQLSG